MKDAEPLAPDGRNAQHGAPVRNRRRIGPAVAATALVLGSIPFLTAAYASSPSHPPHVREGPLPVHAQGRHEVKTKAPPTSVLFVPAGVGVTRYLGLIADEWAPILVALFASTLFTLVVTAALAHAMLPDDGR